MKFSKLYFCLFFLVMFISCSKDNQTEKAPQAKYKVPEISIEFTPRILSDFIIEGENIVIDCIIRKTTSSIEKVELYANQVKIGETISQPYTINWDDVQAGHYLIYGVATDQKGYKGTSNAYVVKVLSKDKPYIHIESPRNGYEAIEGSDLSIEPEVKSFQDTIEKVEFFNHDEIIGIDSSAHFEMIWQNIPSNNLHLTAIAYDNLGNSTKSNSVYVFIKENIKPTVSLLYFRNHVFNYDGFSPTLEANDADGDIETVNIFCNDSLVFTGDGFSYPNVINFNGYEPCNYKVKATVLDDNNAMGESGEMELKVLKMISFNEKIIDIKTIPHQDLALALSQYQKSISYIDLQSQTILGNYPIDYYQPLKIELDNQNSLAYVAYKYTGKLSVWDIEEKQIINEIEFSETADVKDLEISEEDQKIFVSTNEGIFIIDLTNGNILNNIDSIKPEIIEYDATREFLFTIVHSENVLKSYEVISNNLFFKQEIHAEYNQNSLELNEDNSILFTNRGYDDALDPGNLNNALGEWGFGHGGVHHFSNNNNHLIGASATGNSNSYMNFVIKGFYENYANTIVLKSTDKILFDTKYNENYIIAYIEADSTNYFLFIDDYQGMNFSW